MTSPSEYISELFKRITVLLTLLLLQLIVLLDSVARSFSDARNRMIATNHLLGLIEHHIPTTRFQSGTKPDFKDCAVCLSNFENGDKIRKLQCKHTFHKDCLDKWMQRDHATCPLCRQEVLPEDIAVKYRRKFLQADYSVRDEEVVFFLSLAQRNNLHRLY